MDFTPLLSRAWRVTRHERGLWPMALIATGSVGGLTLPSFGNSGGSTADLRSLGLSQGLDSMLATVQAAMRDLRPALVGVGVFWLVVLLLVWLLVVRAEAALSWATLELARDGQIDRRAAWRQGRHFFWRFAGLSLIAWLAGLLLTGAVLAWAATHRSSDSLLGWWEAYSGAAGSPLLFVGTLALVPLWIWLGYARRSIALVDASLGRGLALGWRTLRRHLGASLLGWIINVAFYTAALIGVAVVMAVLAVIAAIVFAVILHALPNGAASLAGGLAPYVVGAILVALVLVLLVLTLVSLFLWSFWSQLYLRLSAPVYDAASVAVG